MKTTYYIDANNLYHADIDLRKHIAVTHQQALRALITRLEGWLRASASVSVVLAIDSTSPQKSPLPRVVIASSEKGATADDTLRWYLHHKAKSHDVLVSNDTQVYNAARSRGISAMTCEAFLRMIATHSNQQSPSNQPKRNTEFVEKAKVSRKKSDFKGFFSEDIPTEDIDEIEAIAARRKNLR